MSQDIKTEYKCQNQKCYWSITMVEGKEKKFKRRVWKHIQAHRVENHNEQQKRFRAFRQMERFKKEFFNTGD